MEGRELEVRARGVEGTGGDGDHPAAPFGRCYGCGGREGRGVELFALRIARTSAAVAVHGVDVDVGCRGRAVVGEALWLL